MKIIITGAGKGSRFLDYGISIPKYLIKAKGKTLLEHSLLTLSDFFSESFIFIFRDIKSKNEIIEIINHCKNEKNESISDYKIVDIDYVTKGQAETVLLAKEFINNADESILIFNIDTCVLDASMYIKKEDIDSSIDGLIYTTKTSGVHWSFAKTLHNSSQVILVSEKIRISDNASIGLYYFKSFYEFNKTLSIHEDEIIHKYKELYVMPIYSYLINDGKKIIMKDIPFTKFVPLGTPSEILNFDKNFVMENKNV